MRGGIKIDSKGNATLAGDTALGFKLAKSAIEIAVNGPCPKLVPLPIRIIEVLESGNTLGLATSIPLGLPPVPGKLIIRAYNNPLSPDIALDFETVGTITGVGPGNVLAITWSNGLPSYTPVLGSATYMLFTVDLLFQVTLPMEMSFNGTSAGKTRVDWFVTINPGVAVPSEYKLFTSPQHVSWFHTMSVEVELLLAPTIEINEVVYILPTITCHPTV